MLLRLQGTARQALEAASDRHLRHSWVWRKHYAEGLVPDAPQAVDANRINRPAVSPQVRSNQYTPRASSPAVARSRGASTEQGRVAAVAKARTIVHGERALGAFACWLRSSIGAARSGKPRLTTKGSGSLLRRMGA